MKTRKSVFSGSWYPRSASACEREIENFLKQEKPSRLENPVGGIVPHAGWFFSGSIACNVIHALSSGPPPDVVVVFGMHLHPGASPHIMPEGEWETPFGPLEVETRLAETLTGQFRFGTESPERFVQDNTVELQLPFIKYFFKDVRFLAVGVPPAPIAPEIARHLVSAAQETGLSLKVIGSTDLTHYGPNYDFTPQGTGPEALDWVRNTNDRRFVDALLAMNPDAAIQEGLQNRNACCAGAAAAAVAAASELGATQAESLAYATSHDRHPGESFVGYSGVVFA